jgi:hypothetical protein
MAALGANLIGANTARLCVHHLDSPERRKI